MDCAKIIPQSKTRDIEAVFTEFSQLAVKYQGHNFCHGVPGLPPPKFLTDELKDVVDTNMNNHYCPVIGHPVLREAIAKCVKPHFNGREINPATDILVTNGAMGSIFSIF